MAISRLLSDRGESVSTFVMTGLPMSLLGLSLLFSFQSLQAPRLSAEPYRGKDFLGATKNPLGEWASSAIPICREITLSHRLGCQIASGHWLKDYSTLSAPVKGPTRIFCAFSLSFRADPASPSPLGRAICLSCVEPCDSHRPENPGLPQMSARGIVARFGQASSAPRIFFEKFSARLRAWHSVACRPGEPCLPEIPSGGRSSHPRRPRHRGGRHRP